MVESTVRRIYRSRDDRVIGGVAGGIASYLGVDPVLIRISFVALAFAVVGIAMYIIGWVIIPEAPADGEAPSPAGRTDEYSGRIIVGTVMVGLG
ncbi:MAG: PspC domain-containing protein, partial [Acidimicrobiia bacterium]